MIMANLVTINGASIDADDPCALYQALYAVKLKMLAGEHVAEFSLQSPVTRETVTFASGRMEELEKELMRLSAACTAATTGRRQSRRWNLRY